MNPNEARLKLMKMFYAMNLEEKSQLFFDALLRIGHPDLLAIIEEYSEVEVRS